MTADNTGAHGSSQDSAEQATAGQDSAEQAETEPDYRFTLANERTFLAWLRTALGLVAGGVAVQQLVPGLADEGPRTLLAALCIGLALVIAAASYPRWRSVQRAMRRNAALPRNVLLAVLGAGILAITAVALVLVLVV